MELNDAASEREDRITSTAPAKGKILVADDDPHMQLAIKACLTRKGYDVQIVNNGVSALEAFDREPFEAVITDQQMPQMSGLELLATLQKRSTDVPIVMITAYGTITQAVEAMQNGAADFITKPFAAGDLERVLERVMSPETKACRARGSKPKGGRPIITNDPLMIRVLEVAEAVSRSDATVLIQGESGTGKELIARFVHASSPRSAQPFVAVNCAALPASLLESELFGHEKGAFTGAQTRKIGKFELAHGGTILLDEISEMELALQAKLLRVLQEREVDRVGGKDPVSIDVRVLATTNRNLEESVREGKFRADLYYRLNVIPLTLPPLRERRSDIRLLTEHFMRQFLGEKAPQLPAEVTEALVGCPWPGNVRELQNAVQRAAILSHGEVPRESDFLLSSGGRLSDDRFPAAPIAPAAHAALNAQTAPPRLADNLERIVQSAESAEVVDSLVIRSGTTVQDMERALILETLRATRSNRTEAARLLGISIRTLRNKLHEYREQGMTIEE